MTAPFAETVRRQKELHPDRFCQGTRDCLWRIVTRAGPSPCPRHPTGTVRNDLEARLRYQTTANTLMSPDEHGFTPGEFRAMDYAYSTGITPAVFVESVRVIRGQS